MKGFVYAILFMLLFLSCHKDTVVDAPPNTCNFINFKYYWDAKDTLGELSDRYIIVAFDTSYSETEIRKFISTRTEFDQNYHYTLYSSKLAALKFSSPKTCVEITNILFYLEKEPIVDFAHYTMQTNDCQSYIMMPMGNLCVISYFNFFYVKVRDEKNLADLYKMIGETKTVLVEQNPFMKDWFVLKCTKNSKGDALHMANYFYESKLFVTAEPDIGKLPVE